MTKSEREIIKTLFGYRDGEVIHPPAEVPNEEGYIIGGIVQANTRFHIAAQHLERDGIVEVFKHKDDDTLRLVVPAYRGQ